MKWTSRHTHHWTLGVISSLLLLALPATSKPSHQDKDGDSCVLPYPGPTRGGHPAQELSRVAAVDYKECLHQCCQRADGECNLLLFSPPEFSSGGSTESSCVLYRCQNLSDCNITTRPVDQVFAEAQFVRQLLVSIFNGLQSSAGKPSSSSSSSLSSSATPENRDATLAATKTPAGSEPSEPGKSGGRDSLATTPHAGKTLSRSSALKDTKDSGGFTPRGSAVTHSVNAQTGATTHKKGSLVPPADGTAKPQSSGSGKKVGITSKSSSSETVPPKAKVGAGNVTLTSSLSSSKLTEAGTSGVQSSTKQSGISDAHHTMQSNLPKATTSKANSLTQSGNGSSSHSSVTQKTNSVISGLTVAQTAKQTTPQAKKKPASSLTGKPALLNEITSKPMGSTPQANVLQTTQRKTNATTLPAKPGSSSVLPKSTSVPKSHPTGSPSTVHNATIPGASPKHSSGTSPSSGHATVSNSTSRNGTSSSSAASSKSSTPAHPVTGGAVTKMTGTETTPFSHNGTVSNASLVLGQLSDNGNHTSTWKDVMADQSLTTMAILISALTLGCIFLLVTLVIVGKRLVDCWRNRKYSKINRDYLIDGMYDE